VQLVILLREELILILQSPTKLVESRKLLESLMMMIDGRIEEAGEDDFEAVNPNVPVISTPPTVRSVYHKPTPR
jgi:hypothetical protein